MALGRTIDPVTLAAISAPVWHPVVLLDLKWPGGAVRAHTGVGDIAFQGNTFTGVGSFGRLTLPSEASGVASFPAQIELMGVDSALDRYLADDARGISGTLFVAAVTEAAGNVMIGSPFEIFTGYLDTLTDGLQRSEGGRVRSVSISLLPGPSQRSTGTTFHTFETQIAEYPGDTAGRFVQQASVRGNTITWPI